MPNSLRAKLSKLRHEGNITDAEYQAFIKKLDGHDREIINKAIDDFAEVLRTDVESFVAEVNGIRADLLTLDYLDELIDEVTDKMKGGV